MYSLFTRSDEAPRETAMITTSTITRRLLLSGLGSNATPVKSQPTNEQVRSDRPLSAICTPAASPG
jgi:hypothetical protein